MKTMQQKTYWECITVYANGAAYYLFRDTNNFAHFRMGERDVCMHSYADFLKGQNPSDNAYAEWKSRSVTKCLEYLGFSDFEISEN